MLINSKPVFIDYRTKRRSRGAALLETLLISSALLLFMTGIPMMGSLVDLKQTAIQASRYVAWEKTIQPNEVLVTDQVTSRFFKDQSAPIRTLEPPQEILGTNLLWGDLMHDAPPVQTHDEPDNANPISRSRLPLYKRARVTADVQKVHVYIADESLPQSVQFSNGIPTTHMAESDAPLVYDRIAGVAGSLGRFLSKDGWENADPYINGLMRSQVEVKVKNNQILDVAGSNCSQGGVGCVHESTSILVDGWAAADPNIIRDRVHGFVPSNRLQKVGQLVSKIKVIPMLKDLRHLENAFGCVKLGVRPSKDMRALPKFRAVEGDDC